MKFSACLLVTLAATGRHYVTVVVDGFSLRMASDLPPPALRSMAAPKKSALGLV
eukprot:CAMPEP_0181126390 /NCGR_PEP_ID=MMETSP1071-20121207/27603_1 /TAXON_ID=35127 /ORGANISM="Thalassiosira sp., Strain NH16" /LENGTH=53 /DNA_ID=CAMNT_0023211987 /DNA_START=75 /DNA_END=233 /DNA_ORIENTATION=+